MRQYHLCSVLIGALALGALSGCSDDGAVADPLDSPVDAASSTQPQRRIVTEMMSFAGPEGWQIHGNMDQSMIRAFIDPDGTAQSPNAKLTIWHASSLNKTLDELAQEVADEWGGEVMPDELELRGHDARRVVVEHGGSGLQPVQGMVVKFFGNRILIEASVTPDYEGDIDAALQELLDKWSWMHGGGYR